MHSAIKSMLEPYQCNNVDHYRNAIKEIVQEIALLRLYRGGFYNRAALYGGTALHIFHGVERFSEDLDFSLIEPDHSFELSEFTSVVQDELGAYGFEMTVDPNSLPRESILTIISLRGKSARHSLSLLEKQGQGKGFLRLYLVSVKRHSRQYPSSYNENEAVWPSGSRGNT